MTVLDQRVAGGADTSSDAIEDLMERKLQIKEDGQFVMRDRKLIIKASTHSEGYEIS